MTKSELINRLAERYSQLVAKDAAGRDVEWSIEMGAPMYLYARGWRPRTLRSGMRVNVSLNPLRNGKPGGVVRDVTALGSSTVLTMVVVVTACFLALQRRFRSALRVEAALVTVCNWANSASRRVEIFMKRASRSLLRCRE